MSDQTLSSGPEGTIDVNDAIKMAKNWRDYIAASQQKFTTQSFAIPIIDLQNILKYNPNAEEVRAYIGLELDTDPTTTKLMLVPVVDGKDVLYINAEDFELGTGDQSNVYDLTKNCPPICSTGSPMNE